MGYLPRVGFLQTYHKKPEHLYFSPGRVNLIGEHIDYNGGYVLPFAVDMGIYAAVGLNDSLQINCLSEGFNNNQIISFNILDFEKSGDFNDYLKAIIFVYYKYYNVSFNKGLDLYLTSTLPSSSGLSSSACILVLMANIINDYFNVGLNKIDIVNLARSAEREYIGVNCGIMDQFAVEFGLKDKAMLLNTYTLEFKYVDFKLDDYSIVIINTNKPRNLISSKYNERVEECDKALGVLKQNKDLPNLCSYTLEDLDKCKELLDDLSYRRARHVISENNRVIDTVNNLNNGNINKVASLLLDSHKSLKDDYEVTGIELDTIFDLINEREEFIGVRMTGAGFGGCLVSLISNKYVNNINKIMESINDKYHEICNLDLKYYLVRSSDGCKLIS